MKKQRVGVWVDKKQAVIISLQSNITSLNKVKSNIERHPRFKGETNNQSWFGDQAISDERSKERKVEQEEKKSLNKLAERLENADEIVLFGPAEMKIKLKKIIEQHNPFKGTLHDVETTDAMTDNQLVAWVRDYYSEAE